jgi:hypothetical protein
VSNVLRLEAAALEQLSLSLTHMHACVQTLYTYTDTHTYIFLHTYICIYAYTYARPSTSTTSTRRRRSLPRAWPAQRSPPFSSASRERARNDLRARNRVDWLVNVLSVFFVLSLCFLLTAPSPDAVAQISRRAGRVPVCVPRVCIVALRPRHRNKCAHTVLGYVAVLADLKTQRW